MLTIPISLLVAHFLGDFVLQSDWMATNKSRNWFALLQHVCVYMGVLAVWSLGHFQAQLPAFVAITFATHFLTDALTSRATSKLWFFTETSWYSYDDGEDRYKMWIPKGGNRHWFFVMIGFDQLVHFATLALTLRYLS